MGSHSLFNLILKVIGLFFIKDVLESFSHTLSALVYFPQYATKKEAILSVAATLPSFILYSLVAWLFLFRTEKIIALLRLNKNVADQQVTIGTNRKSLLIAAVIIAGFWILVSEIPEFFRHAIYYYQERKLYVRMTRPDISYPIMSLIKILIGLILIIFNKLVVRIIEWGSGSQKAGAAG
ncbi:MAG: hypothetical protein JNK79_12130 [Chitinophagaceae bacterium]|nr:hypothetical protein [Chitinophagaceae bacterium]